MRKKTLGEMPSAEQLEAELKREKYKRRYHSVLRSTIYTLITVAAIAVLVATLWLPVLQIYGSSMTPTLQDGEIIFSVKTADLEPGDIVAFYYNNKILVKRVICGPGDWVNIDEDGTVYVNEVRLKEPYLAEKALGDCNIELPYQVPDGGPPLHIGGLPEHRRGLRGPGANCGENHIPHLAVEPAGGCGLGRGVWNAGKAADGGGRLRNSEAPPPDLEKSGGPPGLHRGVLHHLCADSACHHHGTYG